jgi:hypothetical protein
MDELFPKKLFYHREAVSRAFLYQLWDCLMSIILYQTPPLSDITREAFEIIREDLEKAKKFTKP